MERIASTTLSRHVLNSNQQTLTRLTGLQLQLATGKRINAPDDDPVGLRQSMVLRSHSAAIDGFKNNIDLSEGILRTAETAFSAATDLLIEVRSMAVQGGTDTTTPEAREALAQSVDSALTRLVDLGNTVHDGRFVFSGTATTTKPFTIDPQRTGVTYQGTQDEFEVEISPATKIEVSHNGQEVFKGDVDTFDTLIRLRDALRNDDGPTVRAMISDLDDAHEQITTGYGDLGGRSDLLALVRNQIDAVQINIDEQASQIEDADLTQVITDYQNAQVALEAGLQAGAKVIQTSLLDFLR